MAKKRLLAFDLGASSGRAIIGEFDGEKITLKEIHRFSNQPVTVNKTLYWDIVRLFHEIKQGILKANAEGGFDSIGIDTWGIDFGLLDQHGQLIANPVHYRDGRTNTMPQEVFSVLPKTDIYAKTGIQHMKMNTLFQLVYLAKHRPEQLEAAQKLLLIPDLLAYFLTGEMRTEMTNASTTNLFSPYDNKLCGEICDRLSIPQALFADEILPTEQYGLLSDELCQELSCKKVPVVAVATHDTASAVVAVPTDCADTLYLSCGTWSLLGTECDKPVVTELAQSLNFTNEVGFDRKIRLLKNIMGLWIIGECKRQWERESIEVSFASLETAAVNAPPFRCYIDPDHPMFEAMGDMPKRIQEFCEQTGQYVPETHGEIMRCVYQSLAFKYRLTIEKITELTQKSYPTLHIIGGGIKDEFLCQMTADACNIMVVAGPAEATAMGNIAVQLIAAGEIKDLKQARKFVQNSVELKEYRPKDATLFEQEYHQFKLILSERGEKNEYKAGI